MNNYLRERIVLHVCSTIGMIETLSPLQNLRQSYHYNASANRRIRAYVDAVRNVEIIRIDVSLSSLPIDGSLTSRDKKNLIEFDDGGRDEGEQREHDYLSFLHHRN
jgi:hypothetical protein